MQVCHIVPTSALDCVRPYDTHLVLAQQYLIDPIYAQFYRDMRSYGKTLILDNGAHELRHSIAVQKLVEVALDLQPQLVVVPDVPRNAHATLVLMEESVAYLEEKLPSSVEYIFTPQGRTPEGWLENLKQIVAGWRPSTIAINPSVCELFPDRSYALRSACSIASRLDCYPKFHLLGAEKPSLHPILFMPDDIRAAIASMDTARAANCTLAELDDIYDYVPRVPGFFYRKLNNLELSQLKLNMEELDAIASGAVMRDMLTLS